MYFRPFPVLSLLTLAGLAMLITLGVWQLDRMARKADAIDLYHAGTAGPPLSLADAICGDDGLALAQRVDIAASFAGPELRYYGRSADGLAGWRLFQSVPVPECVNGVTGSALLVETGFLTSDGSRTAVTGEHTLTRPPGGSFLDVPNNAETGDFHHFDAAEMAAHLGVPDITAEAWLVARTGDLPPELAQTPPARHLGYALTWFGFALTLLGVYLAFHVSQGRLGFTRR